MNYIFNKTAWITLLAIAITGCASSQDTAEMESKLAPASESETVKNLDVQNPANADVDLIAQEKPVDNPVAQKAIADKQNSGIKEGQFVHKGFNNEVTVEIVKVKRIQNPESQQTGNTVAVKLRVKLLAENADELLFFYETKARNIDTYEEYEYIKSTDHTNIGNLPFNAWADAFVWLEIPQGVKVIDIFFPETAVFKNVPIEG